MTWPYEPRNYLAKLRVELGVIQLHPHHKLTSKTGESDDPRALEKVCAQCPVKRDCRRLSLDMARIETAICSGTRL